MFKLLLLIIIFCSEFVERVIWTKHAQDRYMERALNIGFTRTEIEYMVRKQEVRINKGFDKKFGKNCFEAICCCGSNFFTFQKAEDKNCIIIITLWESKQSEVELWHSKTKSSVQSATNGQN
jgi:hypothetical protein